MSTAAERGHAEPARENEAGDRLLFYFAGVKLGTQCLGNPRATVTAKMQSGSVFCSSMLVDDLPDIEMSPSHRHIRRCRVTKMPRTKMQREKMPRGRREKCSGTPRTGASTQKRSPHSNPGADIELIKRTFQFLRGPGS